jgi:hypothetical protein
LLGGAHRGGGEDRAVMARALAQAGRQMPPFARAPPRRGVARSSLSNKAKQVAPLPDMRTKFAPGCAPSQASTVADLRHQRARRRFEVVAALAPVAERAAIDAVPAREHLAGRQRTRAD